MTQQLVDFVKKLVGYDDREKTGPDFQDLTFILSCIPGNKDNPRDADDRFFIEVIPKVHPDDHRWRVASIRARITGADCVAVLTRPELNPLRRLTYCTDKFGMIGDTVFSAYARIIVDAQYLLNIEYTSKAKNTQVISFVIDSANASVIASFPTKTHNKAVPFKSIDAPLVGDGVVNVAIQSFLNTNQ